MSRPRYVSSRLIPPQPGSDARNALRYQKDIVRIDEVSRAVNWLGGKIEEDLVLPM